MTTSITRQTALITGASGGIGAAFAEIFARNGYNLVIIARNKQVLETSVADLSRAFGITVTPLTKDLARPEAPTEIVAELQGQAIHIDVLVNNAGFGTYGLFTETNLKDELEMMQLNMVTLTHLTKLLLAEMIQRHSGKILNVASTAAFQPGPLMAVYYATKAYVLSLSEALANELQGTGVSVTALCPGPTRSGFQSRAAMEDSKLFSGGIMDVQTVARIGYHGLMSKKAVVIPGLRNKLLAWGVRLTPRNLVTRIARRNQERIHQS